MSRPYRTIRSLCRARNIFNHTTTVQNNTEQCRHGHGVNYSESRNGPAHCLFVPFRTKCTHRVEFDCPTNQRKLDFGEDARPIFKPTKAVILSKMTRYEYEKAICGGMSEDELKCYLDSKESDYNGLLERHKKHYAALETIQKALMAANIETRVVGRFGLDPSLLNWADVMFTAGGDGTYLMGANRFINTTKPLIGINTDIERSEGNLLLPRNEYGAHKFKTALDRLLKGDFRWKWRQRIQVTMSGKHVNDDPIELHDQQLLSPEHRFSEHVWEDEQIRTSKMENAGRGQFYPSRVLPCLALNEVFVGESLSSKVSYYEIATDQTKKQKQKSSGVTICTGTGSSSWHFHINHLTETAVEDILSIADQVASGDCMAHSKEDVAKITQIFNSRLRFDPSDSCMAFTIRDAVRNGVFSVDRTGGFAKKIKIRSRMWDACLVIDGGMSFKFNDGAVATFEIAENQALRTVAMD